jgi:hypothetical protein
VTSTPEGPPLPGDEALTPPPPDPGAGDLLTRLDGLPVGALVGSLDLQVSGTAAFAEAVRGSCSGSSQARSFVMDLSDGSSLEISFGPDGGRSRLTAPGIEVDQTLTAVDLQVDGGLVVSADLLTGGTSEPSGHLALTGTCS